MSAHRQARRFRPFGAGVRNCLGQQLAYTNIPTAIAMLASTFRMELSEEVRSPAEALQSLIGSKCAVASTCSQAWPLPALGSDTIWHFQIGRFWYYAHLTLCELRVGIIWRAGCEEGHQGPGSEQGHAAASKRHPRAVQPAMRDCCSFDLD